MKINFNLTTPITASLLLLGLASLGLAQTPTPPPAFTRTPATTQLTQFRVNITGTWDTPTIVPGQKAVLTITATNPAPATVPGKLVTFTANISVPVTGPNGNIYTIYCNPTISQLGQPVAGVQAVGNFSFTLAPNLVPQTSSAYTFTQNTGNDWLVTVQGFPLSPQANYSVPVTVIGK